MTYERYVTEVFKADIAEGKEVIVPLTDLTIRGRIMARAKIGAPEQIPDGVKLVLKSDAGADKDPGLVVKVIEELDIDHPAWGEALEMRLGKKPMMSSMM